MIVNLYSIFDQKTRSFDAPMVAQNDEHAIRTFTSVIGQIPTIKSYPSDYDLYHVGSMDTVSGKLQPVEVVQKISNALELSKVTQGDFANELQESIT